MENLVNIRGCSPVIIVGLSGVGKSTYSELLSKAFGHQLIHTDFYLEYGDYGSDKALQMLTLDVVSSKRPLIVEGSLCYRLLRNGLRYNNFHPPMIIHVGAREKVRELRRPDKDYSKTDVIYKTIWAEYMSLLKSRPNQPKIIYVDTTELV